jgi:tetratricopeptide (TPR) repeat protein
MRLALRIVIILASILLMSNAYCQEGTKPKKPTSKEVGVKPPTPEELARELLTTAEAKKKQGKYDAAIADYDAALEKFIGLHEVYVARASCYFLKLDFNGALADYDRAVQVVETEMEKYKTQAKIKHVLQDAPGEKIALEKASNLQPTLADAYYQRGNLKQFTDDMGGCCEDLNKSKDLGHLQAVLKIDELCGN